jgi:hypothetical protein
LIEEALTGNWDRITTSLFAGRVQPRAQTQESKVQRAIMLANDGELGRAYKAITSDAVPAKVSPEVLLGLQALHPPRSNPTDERYFDVVNQEFRDNIPSLVVDPEEIYSFLVKAPKHKAPAADGARNELFGQLAGNNREPMEKEFVKSLAALIALIGNGTFPQEVACCFASSELLGLQKPGDTKLRPIVLGYLYNAIAAKIHFTRPEYKAVTLKISDVQLGVGTPSGIDKIVHMTTYGVTAFRSLHLFLPDGTNAFNLLDRAEQLEAVKRDFPEFYPLALLLMAMTSNLCVFGDDGKAHGISCETGDQQGQVQGPLLYGITTYAFFKGIKNLLAASPDPGTFIKAYLDDGTILSTTAQLLEVLAYILREGPKYGIILNARKCQLLMGTFTCDIEAEELKSLLTDPDGPYKFSADKVHIHPDNGGAEADYGAVCLGTPIGSTLFVLGKIQEKLVEVQAEATKLQLLREDPQAFFMLMRKCLNYKVNHYLRTISPAITTIHLVPQFNVIMKSTLEAFMNVTFSEIQWKQAMLPLCDGGLGLGIDPMVPFAAFAASFYVSYQGLFASFPSIADELAVAGASAAENPHGPDIPPDPNNTIVEAFADAVARLQHLNIVNCVNFLGMEPITSGKLQALLMVKHKETARLDFISTLEQQGDPRVLSNYHSHATNEGSAYLDANAKSFHLRLTPGTLLFSLKRRFGFPICLEGTRCVCKRKPVVSERGTHFISGCAVGNERINTHNEMLEALSSMCKSAGCRTVTEVKNTFLLQDPDNRTVPDISVSGLKAVNVVLDVKITESDISNLTMAKAKNTQHAVLEGERQKDIKFRASVMAQGKLFIPASISTSGGFGPKFKVFFGDLVKHSAEYNNIPPAALSIYWHRRFSVTLQNALANCFFKHLGRANARVFRDESREGEVVIDQSYLGPASVSNRRGLD